MTDEIVVDPNLPLDPVVEPGPVADPVPTENVVEPVDIAPPNPVVHAVEQRSFGRAPGMPVIVTIITGA